MAIKPITVSQINSYISRVLRTDPLLGNVSVIGEISNLNYHNSGHVYFTLKDEKGKINCFLPADKVANIKYQLANEMEIIAFGYISVFERGGYYSLTIKDIEVKGQGNLSLAFNQLKDKLEKEGLFSSLHKKRLPEFPTRIAILTSETGAALQDMLKTIRLRNNMVDVLIYPVTVQGPKAAAEIASAIEFVNKNIADISLMIVGRGGGSMEELWAFNEEIVARAIYNSSIPIISAVGHETDVTISDFVADQRAATPTAAAAMAVPDLNEIRAYLESKKNWILTSLDQKLVYMRNLISLRRARLEGLSPYRILSSGYGAVMNKDGKQLNSIEGIKEGEELRILLQDGELTVNVTSINRRKLNG